MDKLYNFFIEAFINFSGEDFADTARREVFEETGIETEFLSVIALRHHHQHIFNCSDIYVVCHLRPLTNVIQTSKEEIAKCEWMDVSTKLLYNNKSLQLIN